MKINKKIIDKFPKRLIISFVAFSLFRQEKGFSAHLFVSQKKLFIYADV